MEFNLTSGPRDHAQFLTHLPSTPDKDPSFSYSRIPGPRRPVFQLSGDDFSSAASNGSEPESSDSEYDQPPHYLLALKHLQHNQKELDYTDPDFERLPEKSWSLTNRYSSTEDVNRAVQALKIMIRRSRDVLLET